MPAAPWLSWYRKEYLVEMFFNPFSTIIWCGGTPWILRWYARWVARQHGRFTLFWWAKRCFYSLHLSFFAILPFLPLNRSWLLEKDRMLVEKRTIVYLSVAMTRYLFLRFLSLTEFTMEMEIHLRDECILLIPFNLYLLQKSVWYFKDYVYNHVPRPDGCKVTLWDRPFSTEPLIRSSRIFTCVINKWIGNVNVYCII